MSESDEGPRGVDSLREGVSTGDGTCVGNQVSLGNGAEWERRHLAEILAHPAYRRADEDLEFFATDESRGLRLLIEYRKIELALQRLGVRHTLVAFGSARIPAPPVAAEQVARLRAELAASPEDRELSERLARAERVQANSRFYDIARELGRIVGRYGEGPADHRLVLATGGGPGIMEAANRGAQDCGAKSIGFNIDLPHEQFPNAYVTPELCFRLRYFALRKLHFLLRARALVAFPGGFGTLDEVFETLTLVQTRKMDPIPVVLVGESYWNRVFDIDYLVDEGMIDSRDRELIWFREDAHGIWNSISEWYDARGIPLIDEGTAVRVRE